jgi:uncharacterized RDD family membrane protein YckC
MEQLEILTETNVNIEIQPASIGERIVAHLLDWLFIGAYVLIFSLLLNFNGSIKGVSYFLVLIVPFIYDLFFESIYKGQSPGKMIMKIRVTGLYGENPSFSSLFIRWAFRPFENVIFMGLPSVLSIILDKKNRRLGDIAAKTIVVREMKQALSAPLDLPDNYKVQIPQVVNLTEKDLAIVKEAYDLYKSHRWDEIGSEVGLKTMLAIEKKLNIKIDMKSFDFLKTVIEDYTYLNSKGVDKTH